MTRRLGWSDFAETALSLTEPVEVTYRGRVRGTYAPVGTSVERPLICDHEPLLATLNARLASYAEQEGARIRKIRADLDDELHRLGLLRDHQHLVQMGDGSFSIKGTGYVLPRIEETDVVRFGQPRPAPKPGASRPEPKKGWSR